MSAAAPTIASGQIYRNVVHKRDEDQPAIREAELVQACFDSGALEFKSLARKRRAFADGIFMLKAPLDIELAAGDAFARGFYRGDDSPYGRFRHVGSDTFADPLLGFHQRANQIEQFLLERRFWQAHYPPEIALLGERLNHLSQSVLRSVLAEVGIPEQDWRTATGGCSVLEGSYHLTFNHYRPEVEGCGLNSHKDDGFLTILRTTSPGLEVNRNGEWEWLPFDGRYFIINFGLSMEILTAGCLQPIAAVMHRVRRQTKDRSSFGHFTSSGCRPGADQGIYRYVQDRGLERVCESRQLIDLNDAEIYQGTRAFDTHE